MKPYSTREMVDLKLAQGNKYADHKMQHKLNQSIRFRTPLAEDIMY